MVLFSFLFFAFLCFSFFFPKTLHNIPAERKEKKGGREEARFRVSGRPNDLNPTGCYARLGARPFVFVSFSEQSSPPKGTRFKILMEPSHPQTNLVEFLAPWPKNTHTRETTDASFSRVLSRARANPSPLFVSLQIPSKKSSTWLKLVFAKC